MCNCWGSKYRTSSIQQRGHVTLTCDNCKIEKYAILTIIKNAPPPAQDDAEHKMTEYMCECWGSKYRTSPLQQRGHVTLTCDNCKIEKYAIVTIIKNSSS